MSKHGKTYIENFIEDISYESLEIGVYLKYQVFHIENIICILGKCYKNAARFYIPILTMIMERATYSVCIDLE